MATRYVSRLEKLGLPPWVRGICVVLLGLVLVGNVALITYSLARHGGTRAYTVLAVLWILAFGGVLILVRLWKVVASSRRSP